MRNAYVITTNEERDLKDSLEHGSITTIYSAQLGKITRTKNRRLEGLISKGASSVANISKTARNTNGTKLNKGINSSTIAADIRSQTNQHLISSAHSKALNIERLVESAESDLKSAKRVYNLKLTVFKKMQQDVSEAKANMDAAQKKYDSLKKAYETANKSYINLLRKR